MLVMEVMLMLDCRVKCFDLCWFARIVVEVENVLRVVHNETLIGVGILTARI